MPEWEDMWAKRVALPELNWTGPVGLIAKAEENQCCT